MRTETLVLFSDREEEFVNLLVGIGIRKNMAKVLVFLALHPKATSRAIERGTDLSQPEVSLVMKALLKDGWIGCSGCSGANRGRPVNIYCLEKPLGEIMDCIEQEKRQEAADQLAILHRLRSFV